MKEMIETGVNLHKGLAMGMHEEMYAGSTAKPKPTPKPGSGSPKGPKPVKVGGKGY